MEKLLVSSCLLGQPVRYDGTAGGPYGLLQRWQAEGRVIPICPEVAGGLPTPRPPAEIPGGQGAAVLTGQLKVRTVSGDDVTLEFLSGAQLALQLVKQHGIRFAVLKARSPSCGNKENYDGTFTGTRVAGEGVTAAALKQAGVQVFNEEELDKLALVLDGSKG
ncbi:DUF523 domain-containing protein [Pseudomonas sp. OIL-1]|uniref:DUF523 domain-containing protein n=1 Tax=Pseudomonas sp. OIL-1 TaxID=2706126 RepID=UPI0013A70DEA|nr:DUF523 domain-containing protein [Pseudomonas sp. OIL-1]QIB49802.1 DUF523 domain-containing protein [Pseudomonas sp. OIL-1]